MDAHFARHASSAAYSVWGPGSTHPSDISAETGRRFYRYGVPDVNKGEVLQIDPDTCTIADAQDRIGDTRDVGSDMSMGDMIDSIVSMNRGQGPDPDLDFESEVGGLGPDSPDHDASSGDGDDFMFDNLVPDGDDDLMSEEEAGEF